MMVMQYVSFVFLSVFECLMAGFRITFLITWVLRRWLMPLKLSFRHSIKSKLSPHLWSADNLLAFIRMLVRSHTFAFLVPDMRSLPIRCVQAFAVFHRSLIGDVSLVGYTWCWRSCGTDVQSNYEEPIYLLNMMNTILSYWRGVYNLVLASTIMCSMNS